MWCHLSCVHAAKSCKGMQACGRAAWLLGSAGSAGMCTCDCTNCPTTTCSACSCDDDQAAALKGCQAGKGVMAGCMLRGKRTTCGLLAVCWYVCTGSLFACCRCCCTIMTVDELAAYCHQEQPPTHDTHLPPFAPPYQDTATYRSAAAASVPVFCAGSKSASPFLAAEAVPVCCGG